MLVSFCQLDELESAKQQASTEELPGLPTVKG